MQQYLPRWAGEGAAQAGCRGKVSELHGPGREIVVAELPAEDDCGLKGLFEVYRSNCAWVLDLSWMCCSNRISVLLNCHLRSTSVAKASAARHELVVVLITSYFRSEKP